MISVQGAGLGPSWNLGQAKTPKQRSNMLIPWKPIQLLFRDLLPCYTPAAWQETGSTELLLVSFYKRRVDKGHTE